MSVTPSVFNFCTTSCTRFSGADAPALMPIVCMPASHSFFMSSAVSIRCACVVCCAVSASLFVLELFFDPITRKSCAFLDIVFTAFCLFVVA